MPAQLDDAPQKKMVTVRMTEKLMARVRFGSNAKFKSINVWILEAIEAQLAIQGVPDNAAPPAEV